MKRYWLIAVVLLFTGDLFAQIFVGVKGGYSVSTMEFTPVEDNKRLLDGGLDYGLTFKYYNAKHVGFQGELYITHRGYRLPIDENDPKILFKRINTYIELPIFLQFRLNLKLVYLHVNAGPFISYLISAEEGNNTTGSYVMKDVNFNVLRDNRVDYGLMGGAGLSHDFSWGTIQAEIRIGYGFGNLYDHIYTDMPDESRSVVQSINVGYLYRFGKTE